MHEEDKKAVKAFANSLKMKRVRSFATPESREKARLAVIGQKRSPESKERMRKAATGRVLSEETKEKIRQSLLGRKNPNAKNATSFKVGAEHPNWRGDAVGYRDLHLWIERQLGKPDSCQHCPRKGLTGHNIHWANKSGEYKRDVQDWLRLCALCHKKFDKIIS